MILFGYLTFVVSCADKRCTRSFSSCNSLSKRWISAESPVVFELAEPAIIGKNRHQQTCQLIVYILTAVCLHLTTECLLLKLFVYFLTVVCLLFGNCLFGLKWDNLRYIKTLWKSRLNRKLNCIVSFRKVDVVFFAC